MVRAGAQEIESAPPSAVYFAHDPGAVTNLVETPHVVGKMVDAVVMAVTRKTSVAAAWRSLVNPKDRVGIKISAAGGRYFSTHPAVLESIIAGLNQAGIPSSHIVLWDREIDGVAALRSDSRRKGFALRGIKPISGYDKGAEFVAPVLGRLIWGDVQFRAVKKLPFKPQAAPADQLSASSYLATILTREVTKVINVPVLSDEAGCGIAGALYNMTVPNVDNWRRFTQSDGSGNESIAALYADARVGPKVVIHILDALTAQYAGGPAPNPNYAFASNFIYASRDPVALDATAYRQLEGWRREAQLPPIGSRADWLKAAAEMGLGQFAEEKINVVKVPHFK